MDNNTPTVTMRRACQEDVPQIVALIADDPLGRTRDTVEGPLPQSYYDAFDEIERSPNQELIVAELDGRVVGTFQLTFLRYLTYGGRPRLQIEAVHVSSDLRSRGIGRQMMEWAIQRARERGCRLVQLTSHKSRTDAHRFYQRLGFVASHEGMKLLLE